MALQTPCEHNLPEAADSRSACRFCGTILQHTFVDLGSSPLCESYLNYDQLDQMEAFYPLKVYICHSCLLVQLKEYVSPKHIFSDYAYFSSYSDTWLQHAKAYVEQITARLSLNEASQVIEVGSNDGYLLQYFVTNGIPAIGIEPAANVAAVAVRRGVPTVAQFFGEDTARCLVYQGMSADLIIANNTLAQVPGLNDFICGMKVVLKHNGIVTAEFPHLLRLMEGNQFDTIYHEHFSYFSFIAIESIFARHGLTIFDVEELTTHGGSLRIYVRHSEDTSRPVGERVFALKTVEEHAGLNCISNYRRFCERVEETKRKLLEFLIAVKRDGKKIAGYGAPGKGNTLLNYCGIRSDFLDYTVDRSPYKQGKFLPGSHIPIFSPDRLRETRPEYVLILPWNLKEEIMKQISYIREWNGKFVVPIPDVTVY